MWVKIYLYLLNGFCQTEQYHTPKA
ncbi:hypothetical protein CY0110_16487 [Crocosphaera chwakensis CCY0110]|uniref:Uncharacterized protein n=1 Tax=Crocosphaera chwakensis CCY0110 TaxID=391612 RepID=A3IHX9_9CHRO|nr:hypothetical protein CY0110_16487 [Crocosphaera chwakensis CCY0110]